MNILIDLVLLAVAVGVILGVSGKNFLRAVAGTIALVLALTVSWMLTEFTVAPVQKLLMKPMLASTAKQLAEIAQTPTMKTAQETLELIDADQLLTTHEAQLETLAGQYDTTLSSLRQTVQGAAENKTQAMAESLTQPFAHAVAYALLYVLITLIAFLLIRMVLNFILFKSVSKEHLKRRFNIFSCIVGCISAILVVTFCIQPVLEQLRPYTVGVLKLLKLDEACARSTVYMLFGRCNFFSSIVK